MGKENRSSRIEFHVYDLEDLDELKKLNEKVNLNNVALVESQFVTTASGGCKLFTRFRIDDPAEQVAKTIGPLPHASRNS